MVTLSLTFLAHGFGIVRAFQPHRQAIGEESRAIRAQRDFSLYDLLDVEKFERKRSPLSIVMLSAIDPHKLHQCPDVILLLF
jgi:hypothetical protein